jgi:AraC family transcriptional regulator
MDMEYRIEDKGGFSTGYEHSGAPELEVNPKGEKSSETYRREVWIPIVKR